MITAATPRRVYEPEWERQQKKQKERTGDGAEVPLPARKWATGVGKEATTAQKIAQAKVDRVVPGPGPLPIMEDSPVSVTLASGGGLTANLGLKVSFSPKGLSGCWAACFAVIENGWGTSPTPVGHLGLATWLGLGFDPGAGCNSGRVLHGQGNRRMLRCCASPLGSYVQHTARHIRTLACL